VVVRLGAALESRLWVAEGGVRGRELLRETLLDTSASGLARHRLQWRTGR
jgi:hypothetical protein